MNRYTIAILFGALTMHRPAGAQAALGAAAQSVRTAMAAGNHDAAIRTADSIYRVFPGHPSLVMLRAQAFAKAGRLDEAERDVRRLLAWDARYARRALQDSLLAGLRPRLEPVVAPLATRADSAIGRGRVLATLEERDFIRRHGLGSADAQHSAGQPQQECHHRHLS